MIDKLLCLSILLLAAAAADGIDFEVTEKTLFETTHDAKVTMENCTDNEHLFNHFFVFKCDASDPEYRNLIPVGCRPENTSYDFIAFNQTHKNKDFVLECSFNDGQLLYETKACIEQGEEIAVNSQKTINGVTHSCEMINGVATKTSHSKDNDCIIGAIYFEQFLQIQCVDDGHGRSKKEAIACAPYNNATLIVPIGQKHINEKYHMMCEQDGNKVTFRPMGCSDYYDKKIMIKTGESKKYKKFRVICQFDPKENTLYYAIERNQRSEKCVDNIQRKVVGDVQYVCKGRKFIPTGCRAKDSDGTNIHVEIGQTNTDLKDYVYMCLELREGTIAYKRIQCVNTDDDGETNVMEVGESAVLADGSKVTCVNKDGNVKKVFAGKDVEFEHSLYQINNAYIRGFTAYAKTKKNTLQPSGCLKPDEPTKVLNIGDKHVQSQVEYRCAEETAKNETTYEVQHCRLPDGSVLDLGYDYRNLSTGDFVSCTKFGLSVSARGACKIGHIVLQPDQTFIEPSAATSGPFFGTAKTCTKILVDEQFTFTVKPIGCVDQRQKVIKRGQTTTHDDILYKCDVSDSGIYGFVPYTTIQCHFNEQAYDYNQNFTFRDDVYTCAEAGEVKKIGCTYSGDRLTVGEVKKYGNVFVECERDATGYVVTEQAELCSDAIGNAVEIGGFYEDHGFGYVCEKSLGAGPLRGVAQISYCLHGNAKININDCAEGGGDVYLSCLPHEKSYKVKKVPKEHCGVVSKPASGAQEVEQEVQILPQITFPAAEPTACIVGTKNLSPTTKEITFCTGTILTVVDQGTTVEEVHEVYVQPVETTIQEYSFKMNGEETEVEVPQFLKGRGETATVKYNPEGKFKIMEVRGKDGKVVYIQTTYDNGTVTEKDNLNGQWHTSTTHAKQVIQQSAEYSEHIEDGHMLERSDREAYEGRILNKRDGVWHVFRNEAGEVDYKTISYPNGTTVERRLNDDGTWTMKRIHQRVETYTIPPAAQVKKASDKVSATSPVILLAEATPETSIISSTTTTTEIPSTTTTSTSTTGSSTTEAVSTTSTESLSVEQDTTPVPNEAEETTAVPIAAHAEQGLSQERTESTTTPAEVEEASTEMETSTVSEKATEMHGKERTESTSTTTESPTSTEEMNVEEEEQTEALAETTTQPSTTSTTSSSSSIEAETTTEQSTTAEITASSTPETISEDGGAYIEVAATTEETTSATSTTSSSSTIEAQEANELSTPSSQDEHENAMEVIHLSGTLTNKTVLPNNYTKWTIEVPQDGGNASKYAFLTEPSGAVHGEILDLSENGFKSGSDISGIQFPHTNNLCPKDEGVIDENTTFVGNVLVMYFKYENGTIKMCNLTFTKNSKLNVSIDFEEHLNDRSLTKYLTELPIAVLRRHRAVVNHFKTLNATCYRPHLLEIIKNATVVQFIHDHDFFGRVSHAVHLTAHRYRLRELPYDPAVLKYLVLKKIDEGYEFIEDFRKHKMESHLKKLLRKLIARLQAKPEVRHVFIPHPVPQPGPMMLFPPMHPHPYPTVIQRAIMISPVEKLVTYIESLEDKAIVYLFRHPTVLHMLVYDHYDIISKHPVFLKALISNRFEGLLGRVMTVIVEKYLPDLVIYKNLLKFILTHDLHDILRHQMFARFLLVHVREDHLSDQFKKVNIPELSALLDTHVMHRFVYPEIEDYLEDPYVFAHLLAYRIGLLKKNLTLVHEEAQHGEVSKNATNLNSFRAIMNTLRLALRAKNMDYGNCKNALPDLVCARFYSVCKATSKMGETIRFLREYLHNLPHVSLDLESNLALLTRVARIYNSSRTHELEMIYDVMKRDKDSHIPVMILTLILDETSEKQAEEFISLRYFKPSHKIECEHLETLCSLIPKINSKGDFRPERHFLDVAKSEVCGGYEKKCGGYKRTSVCPKTNEMKKATLKYVMAGCAKTCKSCSSAQKLYKHSEELAKAVLA
ncbi:hypothetical protein QR680_018926 [Steinernema hermaphroditum]|uniref:Abnormal cell migration protein 18-like fibronectin type I domain-containing protein n=1 Tax=Steinernema hermaphroditum TaxID=289476 RepID=A0AA39HLM1_9BILA|nr:hypothetical protein QR680_018926 [Steinernema hermaphroditum]